MEFFTGDALFQTHDNLEHLAMMEEVIGAKIDSRLVRQVMQGRAGNHNSAAKYVIIRFPSGRHEVDQTLTNPVDISIGAN